MDMCAAPPENESQLVQYKGAPRITVPPADDSPLSYREDTLVSVFNDIYNHFINLFYIPPERVVFPPAETGRHLLDVAYLRDKLRLAPRVISLLERLPYVDEIHHGGTIWYPSARMVDYRDNKKALEARDPSSISWKTTDALGAERSSGPNVEYMRSMDIALAFPDNGFQHIILDTEANSIRLMADWCELPSLLSEGPLEVPEHVDHYRNHAGYHAPSLLRTYYEDLLSLEIYPFRLDDMIGTYNEPQTFITVNILRQYFGYPNNFQREAWAKVVDQVEDKAWKVSEKLAAARDHNRQVVEDEETWMEYSEDQMLQATQEVIAILGLTRSHLT